MKSGFTLIEMSFVLVIIGLIVGAILTGQDLIRAFQIRKIGTELNQITTTVRTFKIKYDCLPGDCTNATNFFGTGSSCPDTPGATGTCNGDGDGLIDAWRNIANVEDYYAFQQLALAGMILGNFPGAAGGIHQGNVLPGNNMPASSFSPNIGYQLYSKYSSMTGVGGWHTLNQR